MLLERRTVSSKTPRDGKLEITKQAAHKLESLGQSVAVELAGEVAVAKLSTMECTCRGPDNVHVHYFLESERFKALEPGSALDMELDAASGRVVIRPETRA